MGHGRSWAPGDGVVGKGSADAPAGKGGGGQGGERVDAGFALGEGKHPVTYVPGGSGAGIKENAQRDGRPGYKKVQGSRF